MQSHEFSLHAHDIVFDVSALRHVFPTLSANAVMFEVSHAGKEASRDLHILSSFSHVFSTGTENPIFGVELSRRFKAHCSLFPNVVMYIPARNAIANPIAAIANALTGRIRSGSPFFQYIIFDVLLVELRSFQFHPLLYLLDVRTVLVELLGEFYRLLEGKPPCWR